MPDRSKILIAEDNDFVRMQICKFLQDEAYDIVEAVDGSEAIEIGKSERIDLAIVDVRMEPVDGFGFIKAMRGIKNEVPVILVTGDNNPDILKTCAEWGVGAVLIKPVQKERLVTAVSRSLQMAEKRA